MFKRFGRAAMAVAAMMVFVGQAAARTSAPGDAAATPRPAESTDPCVPLKTPLPAPEAATDYPGGLSTTGGGLTPAKVPGATTVTPREAACLYNKNLKTLVVLDATNDAEGVPGAYRAGFAAAAGSLSDATQKQFEGRLAVVTGGDVNRPILVYCHNIRCFLSYNVALRTVSAGYKNVYWMREGISSWVAWGMPTQPVRYLPGMEPKTPAGPTPQQIAERKAAAAAAAAAEIREEMADCDQSSRYQDYGLHIVQFDSRAEADAANEKDMLEQIKYEKVCFGNYRRDAERIGATDLVAEIDATLANALPRLKAAEARGRAAFEKNPVEYMWDDDGKKPAKVRKDLAVADGPLSLPEVCGVFDTTLPPLNNGAINAWNARYRQFADCANTWVYDRDNVQGQLGNAATFMRSDMTHLKGIRPYLCSSWKGPNCVPDARWNALNAVATPANLAKLERARDRAGDRNSQVERVSERMQLAVQALNRAVDAYNNSR